MFDVGTNNGVWSAGLLHAINASLSRSGHADNTFVEHHLEPSYFAAVKNGLDVARPIGVFYEAPLDVDDEGMTRDVE